MMDKAFFDKVFSQINDRFAYACHQVVLINSEMEALRVRYERAEKNRERAFLYSQRLRLIVLEGTRTMFYEYATACSDRLASLTLHYHYTRTPTHACTHIILHMSRTMKNISCGTTWSTCTRRMLHTNSTGRN